MLPSLMFLIYVVRHPMMAPGQVQGMAYLLCLVQIKLKSLASIVQYEKNMDVFAYDLKENASCSVCAA